MKIAFVNQPWNTVVLPVQSGSIAIWTFEVARRLAKSHNVIVYAKRDRKQKESEWHEGVEYRRIGVSEDHWLQKLVGRIPVSFLRRPLRFDAASFFLFYILKVAVDLRRRKCDVIHLHNFSQFAPIVRFLNPRSRIVLHMHCEWLTQLPRKTTEPRLRSVDRIVGCSQFVTDTIRRAFPGRSTSCHAIHNGVDIDRFSPGDKNRREYGEEEKKVLFVGRVSPEKGVHVLLNAFGPVLDRFATTRLEIVGALGAAPREFIIVSDDDPVLSQLGPLYDQDYPAELKHGLSSRVAARVSFAGELSYLDLRKCYDSADVFVYPSVWKEPFGLPVAEAMACGLPVIASRSGGLEEIVVDKQTGLLIGRGNTAELTEAICILLSNGSLREKMGKAGRERVVQMFSWEKVAEELSDLYENMCRSGQQAERR